MNLNYDKGLPSSPETERLVLGGILLKPQNFPEVAAILAAEDFSSEANRRIFKSLAAIFERTEPIDYVSLANELLKRGELESVGSLSFITSLTDGMPQIASLASWAAIVKEKSLARQIIFTAQHISNEMMANAASPKEGIEKAVDRLIGMLPDDRTKGPQDSAAIIAAEGGINVFLQPHLRAKGLPTGFSKLDEMTGGLYPGEVFMVAARPSVGKTALVLNIAANLALEFQKRSLIFSLEMTRGSLLERLICSRARVDSQRYRQGYINETERAKIAKAAADFTDAPIYIDDTSSTSVMDIIAKLRSLEVRKGKVDVVIVDYLQLLQSAAKRENRNQEVSAISRMLKLIAKDYGVCMMAVSQLNRAPEQRRGDGRPQLSDLRESGCLAGSTLITLADSGERVPIASLVGKSGFNIWARDIQNSTTVASQCSNVFSTGVKPVFEITTRTGRTIVATGNHQFYTKRGWTRVDQLMLHDKLACYGEIPEPLHPMYIPDKELYLLGHMIGNGCLLPRHAAQYTTRHRDIAERVAQTAREIFGSDVEPRIEFDNPRQQGGWYQVFLASTRAHTHGVHSAVTEWAQGYSIYGLRSREKCISNRVFGLSKQQVCLFLSSLWEADGTINLSHSNKGKMKVSCAYATGSVRLAYGVQHLLARVGVISSIGKAKQKPPYEPQYHVNIVGGRYGISTFLEAMPFTAKYHCEQREIVLAHTSTLIGHSTTTHTMDAGILYDKVQSISPLANQECFDMTIELLHNFEASNILTHNSLEQDADVVAFVFREEMLKKDREDLRGLAELIVSKNRRGPTGKINLVFLHHLTKFENRADDTSTMPNNDWKDSQAGDK